MFFSLDRGNSRPVLGCAVSPEEVKIGSHVYIFCERINFENQILIRSFLSLKHPNVLNVYSFDNFHKFLLGYFSGVNLICTGNLGRIQKMHPQKQTRNCFSDYYPRFYWLLQHRITTILTSSFVQLDFSRFEELSK